MDRISKWPLYQRKIDEEGLPVVFCAGTIGLPESGAASEHLFSIGKTFKAAGFHPILLPFENAGRDQDLQEDGRWICQDIPYFPVGRYYTDGTSKFDTLKVYLGLRYPFLDFLKSIPPSKIAAIIIFEAGYSASLLRLRSYCRKQRIPLIAEEVEWHECNEPDNSRNWLSQFDSELRMRFLNPPLKHVIVISSYLANYYRHRRCKTFRLPPILDTSNPRWLPLAKTHSAGKGIRLFFCGSPGRERHDLILEAVLQMTAAGIDVCIDYVGFSREHFHAIPCMQGYQMEKLGDKVVFHGRVSEEKMRNIMEKSDFTFIFREERKWAQACFPSKVPESLSMGIPLIANLTTDIGEYLQEGREALIVPELTAESFASALKRAAALTPEQRNRMSNSARDCAVRTFDYRRFAAALGSFVKKVASECAAGDKSEAANMPGGYSNPEP